MLFRLAMATLAVSCLSLTACSNKKDHKVVKTLNTNSVKSDSTLNSRQKSERLALAAEQLISPGSFMYAQDVADQALSLDKNNKRAQMVEALIAPLMATKGILERVKPIAERNEESKAKYAEVMAKIDEKPAHALKTFLLDGSQDITNEKDVQSFIDSINNAFNKQRLFFKNNKDSELTLNIADIFALAAIDKDDICYWQESEEYGYEQLCVEDSSPVVLQYKLNRADNEAIQQIAAGLQVYVSLLNSYSASGAIAVADANKGTDATSSEIREQLLEDKNFATLRTSSGLKNIVAMGMDGIAGVQWARKNQDTLCQNGEGQENRPGYVFSKGICVNENNSEKNSLEKILKSVQLALTGTIAYTFKGSQDPYTGHFNQLTTSVKPSAFLSGSIKDVRDLGMSYNGCGKVVHFGDQTVGGVLPNKDANAILNLNDNTCYEQL